MSDVKVQVQLPEETLRQLSAMIGPGETLGDVLRRTINAGQFAVQVAQSPDKRLLVEEAGKFTEFTASRPT